MNEALRQLWDYLGSDALVRPGGLPALTWAHVRVSLASVLVAAVVAIPGGVAGARAPRRFSVAVSVVNIGRAIRLR